MMVIAVRAEFRVLEALSQRLEPVVAAGRPHANCHDAVAGLADRGRHETFRSTPR